MAPMVASIGLVQLKNVDNLSHTTLNYFNCKCTLTWLGQRDDNSKDQYSPYPIVSESLHTP